ncbi:MAG: glycosyltransferase [Nanoarchaeota archaeon]
MKKTTIVIPAHNEEHRIGKTLEDYFNFFNNLKNEKKLDFEIIVVLNACNDNTLKVVDKFKKNNELIILEFESAGKGFAVVEGFKNALTRDNNLIGFIDADGATPPHAFYELIKNISDYDGIIANRWDEKSIVSPRQTLFRIVIGRFFNFTVRSLFLFSHRDTQCGAKLFTRQLIEKVHPNLGTSEWSFDVDLLFYARHFKFKIKSIPTEWHDKKGSKVNLKKTPGRMFFSVVRLRLIHSPLSFILRFHQKLPRKMQVGYWFGR